MSFESSGARRRHGPPAARPVRRLLARAWALAVACAGVLVLGGCAVAMLNGAAGAGRSSSGGSAAGQDTRTAEQKAADDAISTAVRSKLVANPALKALNLRVDTHDGVVTLRGQVARVEQRDAAQLDARSVKGVRSVQNLVTVR